MHITYTKGFHVPQCTEGVNLFLVHLKLILWLLSLGYNLYKGQDFVFSTTASQKLEQDLDESTDSIC